MCGAAYESCYSCEKANSWRVHTDTADHYYILTVLMDYKSGHDARRAYRALRKRGVDFHDTEGYVPSVQKLLAEIYAAYKGKPMSERKPEVIVTDAPKQDKAPENDTQEAPAENE